MRIKQALERDPAVGAIAVTATDKKNNLARFSSYGDWVDVAAPGTSVIPAYTPEKNGDKKYKWLSGTSMPTPYVSGFAGLLAAQGYSATKIRRIIESTTADLRPFGKDKYFGWGMVNVNAGASCEIVGAPGSETLEGTGGNDVVRAGPGADVVEGGKGLDTFVRPSRRGSAERPGRC